jgi:hypothetical protein
VLGAGALVSTAAKDVLRDSACEVLILRLIEPAILPVVKAAFPDVR